MSSGAFIDVSVRLISVFSDVRMAPARIKGVASGAGGRPGSRSLSLGLFFSDAPLPTVGSVRHGQHGGHLKLFCAVSLAAGPTPQFPHRPFPRGPGRLRVAGVGGREGAKVWLKPSLLYPHIQRLII